MRATPMTEPLTDPSPPITSIVMMLNAWVKKNDFGEKDVMKCAHREPATPVRKALMQNANRRERSTLTPRESAAISLSRAAREPVPVHKDHLHDHEESERGHRYVRPLQAHQRKPDHESHSHGQHSGNQRCRQERQRQGLKPRGKVGEIHRLQVHGQGEDRRRVGPDGHEPHVAK